MYSVFLQKGEAAEAMAFKKHIGLREALSAQLQGDPSSFLRFVSFFLFFFITCFATQSRCPVGLLL